MKRIRFPILLLMLTFCLKGFSQQDQVFAFPAGCTTDHYMAGHVIVKFRPEIHDRMNNSTFVELLKNIDADSVFQKFPNSPAPKKPFNEFGMPLVDLSGVYEICFDPEVPVENVINQLFAMGLFEYVVPHFVDQILYTPNDPSIGSQYYLTRVKAIMAWDICKGDTNKVTAITDTGFEFNHPDLVNAVKYNHDDPIDNIDNDNDGYVDNFRGWDMGSMDNNPQYDLIGHGIHVSGIAGASADNGFGMAGVGFRGKLLPVKVDNAYGNLIATYEGIVYAADHGADVINCSWGSTYSGTLYGQDIINYATLNCNALVVAACGNANSTSLYYPASYNYVMSVAASDINDSKWVNSSYNYLVDIAAPGKDIYSSWAGASFVISHGTSMAAPVVAGAASLVSSYFPQYNMLQVAERLRVTADVIDTLPNNLAYSGMLGTGRLNMYRALTDTMSPSVRLVDWSFSDSANMKFDPFDTLYIHAIALNYLDTSSSALYARLECLSPNVELIDSIWTIGTLNTMQSADNLQDQFVVRLLNIAPSTLLKFRIHFYDGLYHSADYLKTTVNEDYNTLDTNLIQLTVTSKGNFGFNNLINLSQGVGIRFDGSGNLVSGFGFMAGTDMFHVSDNMYSIVVPVDSDFVAESFVDDLHPALFGDQCLYSRFNDSGADSAAMLNIVVNQWTYAWNTPEDENFVLVKYEIVNDSIFLLEDFYAGLFADWDIVNAAENRCWYDASLGAILSTTLDSSIFIALKLLSPFSSTHYAVDMDGFNSSIVISDGFTESEKYTMLKSNRQLAGTDIDGNDIATLIGTGPFDIAGGDTLKLTFAIIAGYSYHDIETGIERAIVRYSDPYLSTNPIRSNSPFLYPNPSDGLLNYGLDQSFDRHEWTIIDMSGKVHLKGTGHSTNGMLDVSGLPEGLYLIRFTNNLHTTVSTFSIIR